jgi:hypothetical protein
MGGVVGLIQERIADIARRCGDLSPLAVPVRKVLVDGNRERALAGTDANGVRFAPLKPSTLERRKGSGPPQAPRGASSRIVTGYVVSVLASVARLLITGSWPTLAWLGYHRTGTKHMARRDPYGFRPKDLETIRGMLRGYVMKAGR